MKSKKVLPVVIVACVALLVGLLIFLSKSGKSTGSDGSSLDISKYDPASLISATDDNGQIADHIKGNINAPVTIYEYADYQCSGCANLNSIMKQLLKEYDGKLMVVFRVFPLTKIHPNAIAAASAVEAAGLQGYWEEYGDLLFSNQAEWGYDTGNARTERFMSYFTSIAGESGSLTKFRQDMSSAEVKKKVDFDRAISESLNIDATPSFFGSNGEEIPWMDAKLDTKEDVLSFFREYINNELKKTES